MRRFSRFGASTLCAGPAPLVHDRREARPDVIAAWAVARGISPDRLQMGAMYDHLFLAVAAAIGGTGLLVEPRLLVLDQFREGTLVLVDDQKVASGASYVAYINPRSEHIQVAREFCRWLKGMLRGTP